jgi:hypothetical protein
VVSEGVTTMHDSAKRNEPLAKTTKMRRHQPRRAEWEAEAEAGLAEYGPLTREDDETP